MEEIRRKRLAEMKKAREGAKFGRVKRITKAEYQAQVTDASKEVTVILCMFAYGQEASQLMLRCLEELAAKFATVKFCKIQGQECVDGYPDSFCPTLIIYRDTNPVGHIKGLSAFGGVAGCTADVIEWELAQIDIWKTSLEENPRKFRMKTIGRTVPGSGGGGGKGRSKVDDSSDDDLDLD